MPLKVLLKALIPMATFLFGSVGAYACAEDDVGVRGAASFSTLPPELTARVLSCLEGCDIARASAVCRQWRDVLAQVHPWLTVSAHLFDPTPYPAKKMRSFSESILSQAIAFHVKENSFVPLDGAFIPPRVYPPGTSLLKAQDLAQHGDGDIFAALYMALYGQAPQTGAPIISSVMAALPTLLVKDTLNASDFRVITSHAQKIGSAARYIRLKRRDDAPDDSVLQSISHTFVVQGSDLKEQESLKSTLEDLFVTKDDHRLVLCLDDDTFLTNGVLKLSVEGIPINVRHLVLVDPFNSIHEIESHFLCGHKALVSFDAKGFAQVTKVGALFLSYCRTLTHFRASALTRVEEIEEDFLHGCERLISFSTQGMLGVKVLMRRFLFKCTSLSDFDTQGLKNVKIIEEGFLYGFMGLEHFDTKDLIAVKKIDDSFLYGSGIKSFNTRGLTKLRKIGTGFLARSAGLTHFETWGLAGVTGIADTFLYMCTGLLCFDARGLTSLNTTGSYFLADCTALTHVNAQGLSRLSRYYSYFMINTALSEEDLARVKEILGMHS